MVLCLTEHLDQTALGHFGKYWVEIEHPTRVFSILTKSIREQVDFKLKSQRMGRVIYSPLTYSDLSSPPGMLGFVKRLQYAKEAEVRMVWQPRSAHQPLEPRVIVCPEIVHYLRPPE